MNDIIFKITENVLIEVIYVRILQNNSYTKIIDYSFTSFVLKTVLQYLLLFLF